MTSAVDKLKISGIGEFSFIDIIKKYAPVYKDVVRGIGDDAAVIKYSKGVYQLLTTDMLVEDVHFTRKDDPVLVGRKALAVNVSDIAAMGGLPKSAVVSIGLPGDIKLLYARRIYQGIQRVARKYKISIVGGDTVKSQKVVISIALTGEARKKYLVTRRGAKQGDRIFVTGRLGNSLKSGRHLTFEPRVKQAQQIAKSLKATAMIDISDGLVADLGHILKQSKAGAHLFEERIPLHKGALLHNALYDGEDFELLFTAKPSILKRTKGFKLYEIGVITQAENVFLVGKNNKKKLLKVYGYEHF